MSPSHELRTVYVRFDFDCSASLGRGRRSSGQLTDFLADAAKFERQVRQVAAATSVSAVSAAGAIRELHARIDALSVDTDGDT